MFSQKLTVVNVPAARQSKNVPKNPKASPHTPAASNAPVDFQRRNRQECFRRPTEAESDQSQHHKEILSGDPERKGQKGPD
jgi:hypothetical protein